MENLFHDTPQRTFTTPCFSVFFSFVVAKHSEQKQGGGIKNVFKLRSCSSSLVEVTVGVQEPGTMELTLFTGSRSVSCSSSIFLQLDAYLARGGATYGMHVTLMSIFFFFIKFYKMGH